MSERADVRVKISNTGFTRISNLMEMDDSGNLVDFNYFKMFQEGYVIFGYDNSKWDGSKEKELILKALDGLDHLVVEEPSNLETMYYSLIEVDQNNNITTRTNDKKLKYTGDFYPVIGFSL